MTSLNFVSFQLTLLKKSQFGVKDEHDDNLHLVHIYNLWK